MSRDPPAWISILQLTETNFTRIALTSAAIAGSIPVLMSQYKLGNSLKISSGYNMLEWWYFFLSKNEGLQDLATVGTEGFTTVCSVMRSSGCIYEITHTHIMPPYFDTQIVHNLSHCPFTAVLPFYREELSVSIYERLMFTRNKRLAYDTTLVLMLCVQNWFWCGGVFKYWLLVSVTIFQLIHLFFLNLYLALILKMTNLGLKPLEHLSWNVFSCG